MPGFSSGGAGGSSGGGGAIRDSSDATITLVGDGEQLVWSSSGVTTYDRSGWDLNVNVRDGNTGSYIQTAREVWTEWDTGTPIEVDDIRFHTTAGTVYTTSVDVQYSTDGGTTWEDFATGIPAGNSAQWWSKRVNSPVTAQNWRIRSAAGGSNVRWAEIELRLNDGAWVNQGPGMFSGSGSPESVVTADPGALYVDTGGGASTTLYVKESGTGNTGWVAK